MARSALRRRAFVLGGDISAFVGKGHPDFVLGGTSLGEYLTASVRGALQATNVPAAAVDRLCIGNGFGQGFCNQGHLGAAAVAADPALAHKPSVRFEAACASGGVAFEAAVRFVEGGSDVVVAAGAEVQTSLPSDEGAAQLASAADHARQAGIDQYTWPAIFAAKKRAYFERYPQEDDLHLVVKKALENAARNPKAHLHRTKLTYEKMRTAKHFLANAELHPHVRLSDCSQVSDGAAAVVVVSEDALRALGVPESRCIEVLDSVLTADNLFADRDPTALANVKAAAERVYARTRAAAEDMQVVEVHDCFTMAEVLMYEALGFAPPGRGLDLLRAGATSVGGELPVNTGGGLIGYGHPVGATGIKQVLEIYNQMKGACGAYQVHRPMHYGLSANMGGDDKTAVVTVYRNCTAA
eukprot:TRINITY_DN11453_c0_g1_i1.p1 TRINITY_DN11453_c0_g1~~TRINITY_DN11453_c0_g1_i1.p1  ORF type:complete len:412 (+),score=146.99 TRINITY_DN11453_c0_g1_i1:60-1295(+)